MFIFTLPGNIAVKNEPYNCYVDIILVQGGEMVGENYIILSDEDLCRLASENDLTAVETLYKRHYELMVNFGLKFCNDVTVVEDSIQCLFVELICSPRYFARVNSSVRAWLLTSLRNAIFKQLKAGMRNISFESFEETFLVDVPEQLEDASFDDAQLQRHESFMTAMRELTSRQRMAIYLHYIRGFSHEEIASMLSMNAQSSMNLVSRARETLRKLLNC